MAETSKSTCAVKLGKFAVGKMTMHNIILYTGATTRNNTRSQDQPCKQLITKLTYPEHGLQLILFDPVTASVHKPMGTSYAHSTIPLKSLTLSAVKMFFILISL